MTFACGLKLSALVMVYAASVAFTAAFAYGLGRIRATRKYWKMLERAGSRFSREDN